MSWVKKWPLVVAFFVLCSTGARAEATGDFGYDSYGKLVESYGNYWARIGQARYMWAKAESEFAYAEYIRSQAAYWWERAKYLSLFVERLRLDLYHLKRREAGLRAKRVKIEKSARSMMPLKMGKTSPNIFAAVRLVKMEAVEVSVFLPAEKIEVPELGADQFIANKKGVVTEAFPIGNVAKLLYFIEQKNFSLVPGSDAYFAVLGYLGELERAANEKALEIERYMRELEDGTLDLWRPPSADVVPNYPINPTTGLPGGLVNGNGGIGVAPTPGGVGGMLPAES